MSWGDASKIGGAGGPVAWSPTGFYKIGNLAISLVDFNCYVRKTDGSTPADPSADTTNWQPYGARAIKGIQRGVLSGNQGVTATITSVVTGKTELRYEGGYGVDSGGTLYTSPRVTLTNSTTLTLGSMHAGGASYTLTWELTEYY